MRDRGHVSAFISSLLPQLCCKGSQISKTPNMWLDPPLFSVGIIYARQLDVRVAMSGCFVVSFLLIFVTAVLYLFLCISFLCVL